jgi:hypothetical protein
LTERISTQEIKRQLTSDNYQGSKKDGGQTFFFNIIDCGSFSAVYVSTPLAPGIYGMTYLRSSY